MITDPKTSAIVAGAMSVLRSLGVIALAVPPILALWQRRDLAGFVALVQGDALLPAITAVSAIGLMVYGVILRVRGHKAEQTVKDILPPK